MKDPIASRRLWHVALRDADLRGDRGIAIDGVSLDETEAESAEVKSGQVESAEAVARRPWPRLSDQQRLAVVLQGVALLAHLDHAGCRLGDGTLERAWRSAFLVAGDQLRVSDVRAGRSVDPPHHLALRLLRLIFGAVDGEITGKGPPRKAARSLLSRWRQQLYVIQPDVLVMQVLDTAPSLWNPSADAARQALVGEHWHESGDRQVDAGELWVVGPGRARQRFLKAAPSRGALLDLLASQSARDVWDGFTPELDPWRLYRSGRYRRAAAVWRRRGTQRGSEALAFARALLESGRGSEALGLVKGRKDPDALLVRFLAQMDLGEKTSAKKTLHHIEKVEYPDRQLVRLGEMAIRLYASRGDRADDIRRWVARLLEVSDEKARLGGLIVAASAAWDRQEDAAMAEYLEQARPALDDPDVEWRWHHAEALRCYSLGLAPEARSHVEKAFLLGRRRLGRQKAARLWNDVGVMRLLCDDIAGAEKACRHGVRLLIDCDGTILDTLALHNLASLGIRRGRLENVEQHLESTLAENRRTNNTRAAVCDLELLTRFELARGRPEAALLRRAEVGPDVHPSIANRRIFAALAGRAHGWLGRQGRAAANLEEAGEKGLEALDQEERAAAWALAGDLDRACRLADHTPWEPIFRSIASDVPVKDEEWARLDTLEPYRAARLLHDVERLRPGTAPAARTRRAAELLRRIGAPAMAEVLDRSSSAAWLALRRFLAAPAGTQRLRELFEDAGYTGIALSIENGRGPRPLIEGPGGPARLEESRSGRKLVLEAPFIDETQKTFFSLIVREVLAGEQESEQESAEQERAAGHHSPYLVDGIVGESEVLRQVMDRLDRFADSESTILILGESGTGKELAARRVHRLSRRAAGPFLAVNCAAFSESVIQSELFGHTRGAFTGADRDRKGIFEAAHSGTVFLDEIGDLPLEVQGILLRVLQEKEVRRVGDTMARRVDTRVVAATHQGLERMVEEGTFRRDLFFRLNAGTVALPPLRDRGRDVVQIARHFLKKAVNKIVNRAASARNARGRDIVLGKTAEHALVRHPWPGNIRELINRLEVALALCDGNTIEEEHLELPRAEARLSKRDFKYEVEQLQRQMIVEALAENGGNQSQAAISIGLTRQAFSYHVQKFKLR